MKTYFRTDLVEQFLKDTGNSFLSLCWYNDMTGKTHVEHTATSNWFKRHIPSNTNQYLFSLLELHIPTVGIEETTTTRIWAGL